MGDCYLVNHKNKTLFELNSSRGFDQIPNTPEEVSKSLDEYFRGGRLKPGHREKIQQRLEIFCVGCAQNIDLIYEGDSDYFQYYFGECYEPVGSIYGFDDEDEKRYIKTICDIQSSFKKSKAQQKNLAAHAHEIAKRVYFQAVIKGNLKQENPGQEEKERAIKIIADQIAHDLSQNK